MKSFIGMIYLVTWRLGEIWIMNATRKGKGLSLILSDSSNPPHVAKKIKSWIEELSQDAIGIL